MPISNGSELPTLPLTVFPNASTFTFAVSTLARVSKPRNIIPQLARRSILPLLSQTIRIGVLKITDCDGRTRSYGNPHGDAPEVTLIVVKDTFWSRLFLSGDLGLSEAYMAGDVHIPNLPAAMKLWIDNQSAMESLSSTFTHVTATVSGVLNRLCGQTPSQARLNAIASYDQSNELFKAFLSEEMTYSCALWSEAEGGVKGDLLYGPSSGDLEAAQMRKIHMVLKKARVKPGNRILEFGTGWGALAIEAAKFYGCEVDTLTLSKEQKRLAEERIEAAGLSGRIRVHLMDYRDIPATFEKSFDTFISIEMLEHVGPQYYSTFFQLVDFALKPSNATMVISSSTFPECRYSEYQAEDFMRRYMWPNSSLPSVTSLVNAAQSTCKGRFSLDGVENHSAHYPRTLREWGRRLETNLKQDIVARDVPQLHDPDEYTTFKRKWEYLFAYASVGFVKGYISCHMLSFIRANDVPALDCD